MTVWRGRTRRETRPAARIATKRRRFSRAPPLLHTRRVLIRAFIVQRNPHSTLRIHPSSCAPVDVIGADDTASTARQGVGNAPVLIAITTHGQCHARG